jgi:hypothetical protein
MKRRRRTLFDEVRDEEKEGGRSSKGREAGSACSHVRTVIRLAVKT